jgi:predicted RecA/RadA family phage recombinase
MQAQFIQNGAAIDYIPAANTPAGTVVVQGDLVGITKKDINANELGALAVEGLFDIPKDAATAINAGTKVYWKADDQIVVTAASGNKLVGKTIALAPAGASTARVLLTHS